MKNWLDDLWCSFFIIDGILVIYTLFIRFVIMRWEHINAILIVAGLILLPLLIIQLTYGLSAFGLLIIMANLHALLNIIIWPINALLKVLNTIALYLSRSILKLLDGRDKLRSLIVSAGVLFFILGNLFQLIATV
jgi:hypothetical protein